MKIVIFSGTTEGRELSRRLAGDGHHVLVSVASGYGSEEQGRIPGVDVTVGKKDTAGIRELIRGADLVVDATHPYAVLVTSSVREAAEAEQIPRLRLLRAAGEVPEESGQEIIHADSAEDAAEKLQNVPGRILLTTGAKELSIFAERLDPERLIPRVLPTASSIEACEEAGIPHRNIIAVQGPFSEDLNRVLIRDYDIACLVTKDGGAVGGFEPKIAACRAENIPAVVIRRPGEAGMTMEQVLEEVRRRSQETER